MAKPMIPVKHVFKDYRYDTPDVVEKLVVHDWACMIVCRYVTDAET